MIRDAGGARRARGARVARRAKVSEGLLGARGVRGIGGARGRMAPKPWRSAPKVPKPKGEEVPGTNEGRFQSAKARMDLGLASIGPWTNN